MDKCREAFEQYIRSQSGFTADFKIGCNGQYKSDLMNVMFITWQEQQKRIDELNQENQKLVLSNTGYHNASASYLCKLMQIQFVLNQQTEIAKFKRTDGEVFEDKTETKIADYLDDYNIALDKILGDEATQEQFNAYAKGNEFFKQKARADKNQKQIDELQARVNAALGLITSWQDQSYRDDAEQLICVDLEQALKVKKMTKQEIIDNAPDGATHYTSTPMEIIYLKYHGGIWWCFFFGEWKSYELELNETPMPL